MSRRVARKQATRLVREQLARQRRRRRTVWTSVVAVAVLVLAGVIGFGVYASQRSGSYTAPPGAVADGTGIALGSGSATVDVYEDFMCPHCKQFEQAAGASLDQLGSGGARVVYHPLAFLDRASTTGYSTRSAAAAGCAAAGGKFRQYAKALFDHQPAEGSAGLSDDELVRLGTSVGLSEATFGQCVREGAYTSWTRHVTDAASGSGVTGTPTVLVDGKQVDPTAQAITAAVQASAK